MPDYVDTVLSWETKGSDESNKCRIRIYWITWEKAIVIATDITTISGEKIVNVTQEIVRLARVVYDVAPNKLMLIEHYSKNDLSDEDRYIQVLVVENEVVRYEIDKSKLVELIRKPI